MFIHGDEDSIVPSTQSVNMDRKLRSLGVYSRLEILTGVGHGFGYGTDSNAQKISIMCVESFLKEVFQF